MKNILSRVWSNESNTLNNEFLRERQQKSEEERARALKRPNPSAWTVSIEHSNQNQRVEHSQQQQHRKQSKKTNNEEEWKVVNARTLHRIECTCATIWSKSFFIVD